MSPDSPTPEETGVNVIAVLREGASENGLRNYAKHLGISAAYLSDIINGRRQPGPKILDVMDIERIETKVVTYRYRP